MLATAANAAPRPSSPHLEQHTRGMQVRDAVSGKGTLLVVEGVLIHACRGCLKSCVLGEVADVRCVAVDDSEGATAQAMAHRD